MICSIAMSTYNGAKFLPEQLNSIMNQTRPIDEIVINDDASTDQTLEIIAQYQAAHPEIHWKVLTSETNQGWRLGFRRAASYCNGDLIFFCDQDDIWVPNKISRIEQIFNEHPQILTLISDYKTIGADGHFLNPNSQNENISVSNRVMSHPDQIVKILLRELLSHAQGQGCTMAIRRCIIDQYLSSNLVWAHDNLVSTIAAIQGGLYFCKDQLIYYRLHGSNTIGVPYGKNALRQISILQKIYTFALLVKYILIKGNSKEYRKEILSYDVNGRKPLFDLVTPPHTEKLEYEAWQHFMMQRIQLIKDRKLFRFLLFFFCNTQSYKELATFSTFEQYISRFMMDLCAIIKR